MALFDLALGLIALAAAVLLVVCVVLLVKELNKKSD